MTSNVPGNGSAEFLALLQNYGSFFDKAGAGIDGPVSLIEVIGSERVDLSSQKWTYQVQINPYHCF